MDDVNIKFVTGINLSVMFRGFAWDRDEDNTVHLKCTINSVNDTIPHPVTQIVQDQNNLFVPNNSILYFRINYASQ